MSGVDGGVKFPAGFTIRPPSAEEAAAVGALVGVCELHDGGEPDIDVDDILNDWRRPSFDLGTDAIAVFDETGMIVAEADIFVPHGRVEAAVHPDARGRGIGAALLTWSEARAREAGSPTIGQTKPDGAADAAALLRAHGYELRWNSWMLEISHDTEPSPPALPDGIAMRPFTEADSHEVYELIENAFSEWPNRTPTTFEDWRAATIDARTFDPKLMLLAIDLGSHRIVGVAYCLGHGPGGYVQSLAVDRAFRRRGIAKALLEHAFATFWSLDQSTVALSTDSRTGALGLYERVGMRVIRTYTRYSKDL
jgi:mycothiol synthase